MTMDFLQDFSLKIIVKLEPSLNLPMPTVWLSLEVLKTSTGFHSENISSDGFKLLYMYLVSNGLNCYDTYK